MRCAVSGTCASHPRAHSGSPARAPMPRMPSSTTSASARTDGSVVSTTPAAMAAALAPSWTVSVVHRRGVPAGLGEACDGIQGVGAVVARPHERGDRVALALLEPGGGDPGQTLDRTGHELPLVEARHERGLGGVDGRRRPRLDHCTTPAACRRGGTASSGASATTMAEAMPASWDRETWIEVIPRASTAAATVPRTSKCGRPSAPAVHLGVLPQHPRRRTQRLGQCLLGGEPGGLAVERHRPLGSR